MAPIGPFFANPVPSLKARRDIPGLLKLLTEDTTRRYFIIQDAIIALGELGDPRAVSGLVQALNLPDETLRMAAVQSLASLGDSRAMLPIQQMLDGVDETNFYRLEQALHQLGFAKKPLQELQKDLASPSPGLRLVALRAVAPTFHAKALDSLMYLLSDPDRRVRTLAAEWLGEIGDRRAIGALLAANQDVQRYTPAVTAALKKLGWQPPRPASTGSASTNQIQTSAATDPGVVTLIQQLRSETFLDVLFAATELTRQPDLRTLDALLKRIDDERAGEIVKKALNALALKVYGTELAAPAFWRAFPANTLTPESLYWLAWRGDTYAVSLLVSGLGAATGDERRQHAQPLVELYRSGRLTPAMKNEILQYRNIITQRHTDVTVNAESHTDYGEGYSHSDRDFEHDDYHTDEGIGVKFPL